MPLSTKQLYGRKLGASDGEIGHVKDFYFEDQRWAIRYVVADTGSWLPGRLVLLSPYAFGHLDRCGDCLPVKLTRQQIENSPAIESHKPVSRQYEEEYHGYYGWPPYWNGGGLWGVGGFPMEPSMYPQPFEPVDRDVRPHHADDPHLRSMQNVIGYAIQTSDGTIGHVTDFMVDEYGWMIRYLVVETGHWFAGKEIVIAPKDIDHISYEESKVYVKVTKEAILKAPEYHVPPGAYQDAPVMAVG